MLSQFTLQHTPVESEVWRLQIVPPFYIQVDAAKKAEHVAVTTNARTRPRRVVVTTSIRPQYTEPARPSCTAACALQYRTQQQWEADQVPGEKESLTDGKSEI